MSQYFIFIPNLLSIVRIFLMYPMLSFIAQENYLYALFVFALASASDGLDGYLARTMNWQTDLGKILDPIADKVLLIGTILVLWMNSYIPLFVLSVFVFRDFMIIVGAAFHMTVYGTTAPNPNIFGKFTTFVHIAYIIAVFLDIILLTNLTNIYIDLSITLITVTSLLLYVVSWSKTTSSKHNE